MFKQPIKSLGFSLYRSNVMLATPIFFFFLTATTPFFVWFKKERDTVCTMTQETTARQLLTMQLFRSSFAYPSLGASFWSVLNLNWKHQHIEKEVCSLCIYGFWSPEGFWSFPKQTLKFWSDRAPPEYLLSIVELLQSTLKPLDNVPAIYLSWYILAVFWGSEVRPPNIQDDIRSFCLVRNTILTSTLRDSYKDQTSVKSQGFISKPGSQHLLLPAKKKHREGITSD